MRFADLARRGLRLVLVLWVVVLAGTLAVPVTRDVHVAGVRALFRLSRGRTTVSPAGYTFLTLQYRESLVARAANSPDDYLVASSLQPNPEGFPPPRAWMSDPLLAWGAIESAARVAYAELWPESRPAAIERDYPQRLAAMRELLPAARRFEPGNGALDLAESFRLLIDGDEAGAITPLRAAVARHWELHEDDAAARSQRLLARATGIRTSDARLQTSIAARREILRIVAHIESHLVRRLRQAVRDGDDARFAELLSLLARLRDRTCDRALPIAPFACSEDALVSAMAVVLGKPLPSKEPRSAAEYEERARMEVNVWNSYLRAHGGRVGELILGEEAARAVEMDRFQQANHKHQERLLSAVLRREVTGDLVLLSLAFLIVGAVAMPLAWICPPAWVGPKRRVHVGIGFVVLAAPVVVGGFLIVYRSTSAFDLESVCVLMSADAPEPLFTRAQLDAVFAAAGALLPILVLIAAPPSRWVYPAGLLLVAWAYLAAVVATAVCGRQVAAIASAAVS